MIGRFLLPLQSGRVTMSTPTNALILVLIIGSHLIVDIDCQTHCPMHCSTCLPNVISCINGGLLSMPIELQPATERITLAGQFQFHGILTGKNFSNLAPPKYKILYLDIRSSSIQELRSQTFSLLVHLKTIDLSENQRLTLFSSTFDGLKLKLLKLDDIGKLMLLPGCFNGLTTEILSMKNSRLQSLNFDIFSPLSHTLKHLFIENNQIHTVDQRFEPLFYRLDSVNLKENPLICYCPLLWLSKALRSKSMIYKYPGGQDDNHLTTINDVNNSPKCVAPSTLRNRQLQSITESEFDCQVPRISVIEIDLFSVHTGEMSCQIQPEEKGRKIPTKVFWQETMSDSDNNIPIVSERVTSDDSDIKESMATIKIATGSVTKRRNFKCIAENTAGQSSIIIQITWPPLNNTDLSNRSRSILTGRSNPVNGLIPMTPTESYLYTKHYTLLEMTVAIVGTFMVTVLVFLIFYRFYFRRQHGYKNGKPSLKYSLTLGDAGGGGCSPNSNKRALMAFHSPRAGYTVYETSMHYSDNSQTYDSIPHNAVYPSQQQQPLFSTLSNSPSVHFIDYKTHKNLYPSSPSD